MNTEILRLALLRERDYWEWRALRAEDALALATPVDCGVEREDRFASADAKISSLAAPSEETPK